MNKKNNQKGITLIALIITIIVMLILVAVTITVAVNGGLFGYAERAGAKTNEAIANEQILASGKVNVNDVWYDSIDKYLAGEKSFESWPKITSANLQQSVNKILTENTKYEDTNGDMAIIPKGFMLTDVEDEIDKGIVISDEVDSQGNSIGNEYVWVPVEDGTLDRTGWWNNEPTTLTLEEITEGWDDDDFMLYIAKYYGCDDIYEAAKTQGYVDASGKGDIQAWLSWWGRWNELFYYCYSWAGALKTYNYAEDLPTEMVTSVAKYKGFYIARYEAGSKSPRTESSKNTLTEVITKQGLYPYNYMSKINAIAKIGEMYSDKNTYGVVATLTYGAQWDETMKFVKAEKDVTYSKTWGNYKNNTFDFTGKYTETPDEANSWDDAPETGKPVGSEWLLTTGACDENQAKNIYDLAGNLEEWTMEGSDSGGGGVPRGGNYSYDGNSLPASYRSSSTRDTYGGREIGFRPALYIK